MCKSSITFLMMFILVIFLILSGCSSASHEAHKHGDMQMGAKGTGTKVQTTCPVLGGEIDKKFYVDHMGKRVYFCCKMCIAKFNEEPEKYMKKL